MRSTHFNFIRNPKVAATPLNEIIAGDPSVEPEKFVRLELTAPGLAYLYVSKWDRVGPAIDRAFARIESAEARVLILDIRRNSGGSASSESAVREKAYDWKANSRGWTSYTPKLSEEP